MGITKNSCPEIPYFGASYPDSTCIDGYLYDSDKYEDGMFTGGPQCPCPFCNTDAFIDHEQDDDIGETREFLLEWIELMREKYG